MTAVAEIIRPAAPGASEPAARSTADSSFEELLGMLQVMQVTAAASPPAASAGGEAAGESAREARLGEETQDAEDRELDHDATRQADPSSVQDGTVSSRHERIVAEKSAAGQPAQPAAADVAAPRGAPMEAAAPPAARPPAPRPEAAPAPVAATPAPAPSTDSPPVPAEQPPQVDAKSPAAIENPNAAPAGEAAAAIVAVPTGGAARAAAASKPMDVAQTLARMLASRPAEGVVRPLGEAADRPGARESRTSRMPQGKTADGSEGRSASGPARRGDFDKLISQVRLNQGLRRGQATIRLAPPDLGRIKVNVRMVDQNLRVRVEAESPKARALLAGRAADLTAALRAHDLVVERFEVVAADQPQAFDLPNSHADPQSEQAAGEPPSAKEGSHGSGRQGRQEGSGEHADHEGSETWPVSAEDPRLDVRI